MVYLYNLIRTFDLKSVVFESMHASPGSALCAQPYPLPLLKRFFRLDQLTQGEEAKSPSEHPHYLFLFSLLHQPKACQRQWCATSQTFISARFFLYQQTPRGDEPLFSYHSKVASNPWSSKSRFEGKWTLESKFSINSHMYQTDEQERAMIGSETYSGSS